MSNNPPKLRVRWGSLKSAESAESVESEQDHGPADGLIFSRLGELHMDILSAADVVKQVQGEVSVLKQENETLRRELSIATGEEPGLRSSTGSIGSFIGKASESPKSPEPVERPETPPEPETVHPFCPQQSWDEESLSEIKSEIKPDISTKRAMQTQTPETLKRRLGNTIAIAQNKKTSHVGWAEGDQNQNGQKPKRTIAPVAERQLTGESLVSRLSGRVSKATDYRGVTVRERRDTQRDQSIRSMLFDPSMIKEQMKKAIIKPDLTVYRFYHKEGIIQKIARSQLFENVSLAIILFNTVWIAVDTEHNQADVLIDADIPFQIIEHCFCTYFFMEILIRFLAFRSKRNCLRSGWFIFDSVMVTTMVIEDWIMTILLLATTGTGDSSKAVGVIKNTAILRVLRLMRLARLGRAIKLMRQSPEVMIMVKALSASTRCVLWTCVLLACLMFFFSVCFTQMCKDTRLQAEYFPSLTGSLHTLMIAGLFPDLETISFAINKEHIVLWLLFLVYLMMTTITVLNLLIGVLVEVVKASASVERDAMDVAYVKEVFVTTLALTEVEDFTNILVCKEEFVEILQDPDILKALMKVGIDVFGLIDLMDFIFMSGAVGFAHLLEVVLQLRSGADVTVKDLVEVRKFLTYEISRMKTELSQLNSGMRVAQERTAEIMAITRQISMSSFARATRPTDEARGIAHTGSTENGGSELRLADL